MTPELLRPWEPQGRALLDAWRGEARGELLVHAEALDTATVHTEAVDPAHFLRPPEVFEVWERRAIEAARGVVLDLGAGGGSHALALQARGHELHAYDVDERVVTVLRERGLEHARLASLLEAPDACCDTLLLLMHGAGLAGDEPGLELLLEEARRALRPGGQLLLDGRGPVGGDEAAVSRLQLEYDGELGAPYDWLWPSAAWFRRFTASRDWTCETLLDEPGARWLMSVRRDA